MKDHFFVFIFVKSIVEVTFCCDEVVLISTLVACYRKIKYK